MNSLLHLSRRMVGTCFVALILVGIVWGLQAGRDQRNLDFMVWSGGDSAEKAPLITNLTTPCPDAPFLLPAPGFIGLYYSDPRGPYSRRRRHQGIDIFTNQPIGSVPIRAAYDGYLSRKTNWISTVILRVPQDPLDPSRQIWLYYTHMADESGNDFIAGDFYNEKFVTQGTIIGYIGNYDGNVPSRIWPHLHFSITTDDGNGNYLNEAQIANTLDPSPYFGLTLNYNAAKGGRLGCE